MDVLFTPSERSWRKASSRLGPVVPLVLACASVWQLPHDFWNITLPLTRLEVGCLTAHPATASIMPIPAMSRIAVLRRRDGQRSISQAALYPFRRRAGVLTRPRRR